MNAVAVIEGDDIDMLDVNDLSRLIGVPQCAIKRWLRGVRPIPHVRTPRQVMFPKVEALAWMVEHVPLVRARLAERGLL